MKQPSQRVTSANENLPIHTHRLIRAHPQNVFGCQRLDWYLFVDSPTYILDSKYVAESAPKLMFRYIERHIFRSRVGRTGTEGERAQRVWKEMARTHIDRGQEVTEEEELEANLLVDGGKIGHEWAVAGAHGMLAVAALIYSGYNVVLAAGLDTGGVTPTLLSLCREVVATPVLYIYAWSVEGRTAIDREDLRIFVALAVILGLFQLCFVVGVAMTDATTAAILQCVEPSTAAVVAAVVGAERCSLRKVASALLAGTGVIVLQLRVHHGTPILSTGGGLSYLLGCVFLFGQGLGIAAYCLIQKNLVDPSHRRGRTDDDKSTLQRRRRRRKYGPITVTAHAYLGSLGIMVVAVLISSAAKLETPRPLSTAGLTAIGNWRVLLTILYSAFLSSVLGYTLRAKANIHVDASMLVLYNAAQPPLTAILTFIFQHQPFGLKEAAATLLVILAVLLATFDSTPFLTSTSRSRRRSRSDESVERHRRHLLVDDNPSLCGGCSLPEVDVEVDADASSDALPSPDTNNIDHDDSQQPMLLR